MTTIAILGGNLVSYSTAHTLLDELPYVVLHLVTERPEIGLMGEGPGIFDRWPPCPPHWISAMESQEPKREHNAVRRSWFEKAMGTELSRRGCTFHLRTRPTSVNNDRLKFVGGGILGSDSINFEHILDFRENEGDNNTWEGAVCSRGDTPKSGIIGNRSDDTTEVWWPEKRPNSTKWIQEMSWNGRDPKTSLKQDLERGSAEAKSLVDTIIQNPVGQ